MSDLLERLREERRACDEAAMALANAKQTVRDIAATLKEHQRRLDELLGDLVEPRPLLDLVEAKGETKVEVVEEKKVDFLEAASDEANPHYTWHSHPIERLLGEANSELVGLLLYEELGTVGALATFLSDGDELEDLEVPVDEQGESFRPLKKSEINVLSTALLKFIEEQGIAKEFPPSWVDPRLDYGVYQIVFRKDKEPESGRGVYLKASNYMQAADYAESYWPGRVLQVVVVPDRVIPDGARVEMVPLESRDDRIAQWQVERQAEQVAEEEAREAARAKRETEAKEKAKKPARRKGAKQGATA